MLVDATVHVANPSEALLQLMSLLYCGQLNNEYKMTKVAGYFVSWKEEADIHVRTLLVCM